MSAELKTTNLDPSALALMNGLNDVRAQLSGIINTVSDCEYTHIIKGQSSIGGHARHIIEFMQSLEKQPDVTDYDSRERDVAIEEAKAVAIKALNNITDTLITRLENERIDHPMAMVEKLSCAMESEPIPSTLGREIAYVIQHGVHHIFIIKTLAQMQDITLASNIGVAPATLAYQEQQSAD